MSESLCPNGCCVFDWALREWAFRPAGDDAPCLADVLTVRFCRNGKDGIRYALGTDANGQPTVTMVGAQPRRRIEQRAEWAGVISREAMKAADASYKRGRELQAKAAEADVEVNRVYFACSECAALTARVEKAERRAQRSFRRRVDLWLALDQARSMVECATGIVEEEQVCAEAAEAALHSIVTELRTGEVETALHVALDALIPTMEASWRGRTGRRATVSELQTAKRQTRGAQSRNLGKQFEREVLTSIEWLLPAAFGDGRCKIPDEHAPRGGGRYGGELRMADFVVPIAQGRTVWLECKATSDDRWRLGRMDARQLSTLVQLRQSGASAWVLLLFQTPPPEAMKRCFALDPLFIDASENTGAASLTPMSCEHHSCIELVRMPWGWDLRPLLEAQA